MLVAYGAQITSTLLGILSVFSVGKKMERGGTSKIFPSSMAFHQQTNKQKIPTVYLWTPSYAPLARTLSHCHPQQKRILGKWIYVKKLDRLA